VQPVTGDERSDSDAKSNPPEKKKSLCQAHVMKSRAYIHAHVCIHMHTYINDLQACMHTCACVHAYAYVHKCPTNMNADTRVNVACMHAQKHTTHTYAHIHAYLYTHIHVHAYIYTHTRAHTFTRIHIYTYTST